MTQFPARLRGGLAGLLCLFACMNAHAWVELATQGESTPAQAATGGEIDYKFTFIGNFLSADPTDHVTLKMTFPAGARCAWTCTGGVAMVGSQLVSYACPAPTTGSGDFTKDIAHLRLRTRLFYSARCTLDPAVAGPAVATASLFPQPVDSDINPANNTATLTTPVVSGVDIVVTDTDNAENALAGGFVVHDVIVRNKGVAAARGIHVEADFPAQETCTWSCRGGGCPAAEGVGDIDAVVDLPPYGRQAYVADCDIAADADGTLYSLATATLPNASGDTAPGDNWDEETTRIGPANVPLGIRYVPDPQDSPTFMIGPEPVNAFTWRIQNGDPGARFTAGVTVARPVQLVNAHWSCDSPYAVPRCAVRIVDGRWVLQVPMRDIASADLRLLTGVADGPWDSVTLRLDVAPVNGSDPDPTDDTTIFTAPVSLFRNGFEANPR